MNLTKTAFIQLALENQVLKFGEFKLKSGRISPYFFNAGEFYQGSALQRLGQFYAQTIVESQLNFQHLFGPAYKGLPLATTTAIALAQLGRDTTVTFNRKEIKDHGEGGILMGAPLKGDTIIIDDVITAGTAFREAKSLIENNGGKVVAVVIAMDRCERGVSHLSTTHEIEAMGIQVLPIITILDIMHYLQENDEIALYKKIQDYHHSHSI